MVNHLSDSVSIVDVGAVAAARRPHAARRRRAARHRLRRPRRHPRLHHHRAPRPEPPRRPAAHHRRASAAPTSGCSTPPTSATDARRHAAHHPRRSSATRRARSPSSPDGSTVYAAVFHSGNQTTTLSEGVVCDGGAARRPCTVDGVDHARRAAGAERQRPGHRRSPEVGLIVKFNDATSHWDDELGRNWNNAVRFTLPDHDVFAIDANAGHAGADRQLRRTSARSSSTWWSTR